MATKEQWRQWYTEIREWMENHESEYNDTWDGADDMAEDAIRSIENPDQLDFSKLDDGEDAINVRQMAANVLFGF